MDHRSEDQDHYFDIYLQKAHEGEDLGLNEILLYFPSVVDCVLSVDRIARHDYGGLNLY